MKYLRHETALHEGENWKGVTNVLNAWLILQAQQLGQKLADAEARLSQHQANHAEAESKVLGFMVSLAEAHEGIAAHEQHIFGYVTEISTTSKKTAPSKSIGKGNRELGAVNSRVSSSVC